MSWRNLRASSFKKSEIQDWVKKIIEIKEETNSSFVSIKQTQILRHSGTVFHQCVCACADSSLV